MVNGTKESHLVDVICDQLYVFYAIIGCEYRQRCDTEFDKRFACTNESSGMDRFSLSDYDLYVAIVLGKDGRSDRLHQDLSNGDSYLYYRFVDLCAESNAEHFAVWKDRARFWS